MPIRPVMRFITLRPYLIAIAIIIALLFWMLAPHSKPQKISSETENKSAELLLPKVQVTHYVSQPITKKITLYGRSEANSRAVLRAEIPGKIVKLHFAKGHQVKSAESIVNIEKNELPERLKQAKALLHERELTYKAVKALNDKGLQERVRLAEANSQLLAAKTEVASLQLALKRSNVKAPFVGRLQEQFVERGDYVQVGDPLFSIEDTDPIVIRGDVTEHYISYLKVGQPVTAQLLSGEQVQGQLSYVSSLADDSNTFRVEAEFANSDGKIYSGISTKLTIPLYQVEAIYVSPSALAMDEDGNLGVKTVKDEHVVFHPIQLVEADNNGAWLSGFEKQVDIITLGQGFVNAGDKVKVITEQAVQQPEAPDMDKPEAASPAKSLSNNISAEK